MAPDGRWLEVNPALCRIAGYPAEDLRARTFQDIPHPDGLDTDLAFVRQRAMRRPQREALRDKVEVDETFIGNQEGLWGWPILPRIHQVFGNRKT